MKNRGLHVSDCEGIAFLEKFIELAAITLEFGTGVEYFAKSVLYDRDLFADADLAAEFFLQIGSGAKVVGVDVRFENPVDRQIIVFDEVDDLVCGPEVGAPGRIVEIKD